VFGFVTHCLFLVGNAMTKEQCDAGSDLCELLASTETMFVDLWSNGFAILNDLCAQLYFAITSESMNNAGGADPATSADDKHTAIPMTFK